MSKPTLSILTITYNHSKYISQTIESFLMQKTDFEFEIIIADDASTDNNQEIIREYHKKYPNLIKPILREKNIGMNANFMDALNKCQGKYIAKRRFEIRVLYCDPTLPTFQPQRKSQFIIPLCRFVHDRGEYRECKGQRHQDIRRKQRRTRPHQLRTLSILIHQEKT